MPPAPSAERRDASTGTPPTTGLVTSDIITIAVGLPAGVLALFSVIIAFYAWQYPKSPLGVVGNSVRGVIQVGAGRGAASRHADIGYELLDVDTSGRGADATSSGRGVFNPARPVIGGDGIAGNIKVNSKQAAQYGVFKATGIGGTATALDGGYAIGGDGIGGDFILD
ncbi:hypothetical protein O1611_g1617 [Lasiodiplodia mahajangana]|uniref:Uncharacterized protein n=1 Tax=Lasiodiplodia mahajangana TaxID=1108764 RepID=A0ACC2JWW1_9PEZI|nr:hypothetical protein O1611_g1617 [Lasiodiplodia mahajangana]